MNKRYIGVKIISAIPMMLLAAQELLKRDVGYKGETDKNGDCDGYLVEYEGGYQAWSPKDVFEEAYRETSAMTFGLAIEAMKKGKKVCRAGWNGKGMWLFIAHGKNLQSAMNENYGDGQTGLPICDTICMKTAQNNVVVGWLASQTDMLAEDWIILDD